MPRHAVPRAATIAVFVLAVQLAAGTSAPALTTEWRENPQSRVRLITPYRVAPEAGELCLGLHFTLAPGWHVYWKNSGDAGFPPVLETAEGSDLESVELLYPAPERYELAGDLVAYGYDTEVVYPVRAKLASPADLSGDRAVRERVDLALTLDYLVCKVDCIPYGYTFRLEQPVGTPPELDPVPDPETAALLERWRKRLPPPVTELPGARTEGVIDASDPEALELVVTLDGVRAASDETPRIFLEHHELFGVRFRPGGAHLEVEPADDPRAARKERLRFRIPLEPRRTLDDPPDSATFAWTVTGIEGPEAVEAHRAVPFRRTAPAAEPAARPVTRRGGRDRGEALAPVLLLALAGGFLLALTPGCLALLLAFLLGFRSAAASAEPRRIHRWGGTACGGAVTGALLLALFSLLLGPESEGPAGAARWAGWDESLHDPTRLAALALLCLGQVLWLWGLTGDAESRLSPRRLGTGPATVAGIVTPVLALPWALHWPLSPLPGAIERASASGTAAVVLTAAAAGLGIGLPWLAGALILERSSAPRTIREKEAESTADEDATRHSPRPPSERARQALGFLAALSVFWVLYLLSGSLRTESLGFVELSLLAVALFAWLGRSSRRPGLQIVFMVLLLAAAVVTVWIADRGRLRAPVRPPLPLGATWNHPGAELTQEVHPWHERHELHERFDRSRSLWRS